MSQFRNATPHRITVVGGGAGGLELAVRLGKKLGKKGKADVTLVDAARTHLWKPLLHQIAAGTMDSHVDEIEFLALARDCHFTFRLGRMDGMNREKKEIYLAPTYDEEGAEILPRQAIGYDTLVIAIGSQTNDFGTPGVREHSIMLDSPDAAERFHQRLINSCLRAQAAPRHDGHHFTVTIIGGGATGVELSAELHMTAKIISSYGLAHFDPEKDIRIAVVEAAPRLLQVLPERLSNAVMHELHNLSIETHTNEKVTEVTKDGVKMASGKFIPSDIVVWAAGIKVPDFVKNLDGLETNRINQLVVQRTLQTTRDPSIFAMGDCAACPVGDSGKATVPPRAQSAHQEARLLARSLSRMLEGRPALEFTYKDRGSLVSIGDYSAVGSLMGAVARGSVFIEGTIAKWMYWMLHKQHQIAINGMFHTVLGTLAETIDLARPRIKLH